MHQEQVQIQFKCLYLIKFHYSTKLIALEIQDLSLMNLY